MAGGKKTGLRSLRIIIAEWVNKGLLAKNNHLKLDIIREQTPFFLKTATFGERKVNNNPKTLEKNMTEVRARAARHKGLLNFETESTKFPFPPLSFPSLFSFQTP